MDKSKVLVMARRRLGMPGGGKGDVIRVICDRLQCKLPATWDERYALMQTWVGETPLPVKPPKQRFEGVKRLQMKAEPPAPVVVKGESRRQRRAAQRAQSDDFLLGYEWRRLRMVVIKARGARCECCGSTPKDGIRINVDHVKPRKTHPELALVESNLQVLCDVCNHGKGNWDDTDWRDGGSPTVN